MVKQGRMWKREWGGGSERGKKQGARMKRGKNLCSLLSFIVTSKLLVSLAT